MKTETELASEIWLLKNYMVDKFPKKKIVSVNLNHALFSLLDFLILENVLLGCPKMSV